MFTRWVTPWGGFWGLLIGIVVGVAHNIAARAHFISYGSQMSANFYGAIYASTVATLSTVTVSAFTKQKPQSELDGLVCEFNSLSVITQSSRAVVVFTLLLAAACIILNVWFR
jgi:SSS family solute:Na+ symporter